MPSFAILFRSSRPLDPAVLPRRNQLARDWALALGRDGALVHAAPLEPDGAVVSEGGVRPLAADGTVASVLVISAPDLAAAIALVQRHPGLAFGSEIEVRPVKVVAPAP